MLFISKVSKYDIYDRSDGRVVRASASGVVDSGLIASQVKPMTLELIFTYFLFDVHIAQH